MSNSKKKNPVRITTSAPSEKEDKQTANRKYRRGSKQLTKKGETDYPLPKESTNTWTFSKDGKTYDKDIDDKDLRK